MNRSIVVTGFEPFMEHIANASWEAVRLLPDTLQSIQKNEYVIEKILVPVEYEAVDTHVDTIWEQKPALVVHCGVSGNVDCVKVEQRAYNHDFNDPDSSDKKLIGRSACLEHNGTICEEIYTQLDVKKIVDKTVSLCNCDRPMSTSKDVGSFICGYIYLKSLDKNSKRTLFIHVPPIDEPFSSQELSDFILKIIAECIRQIEEREKKAQSEEDLEEWEFSDLQIPDPPEEGNDISQNVEDNLN